MNLLNIPFGPIELAILFLIVIVITVVIYIDAKKKEVGNPLVISAIIFILLLIGVFPGILGILLYIHLRKKD